MEMPVSLMSLPAALTELYLSQEHERRALKQRHQQETVNLSSELLTATQRIRFGRKTSEIVKFDILDEKKTKFTILDEISMKIRNLDKSLNKIGEFRRTKNDILPKILFVSLNMLLVFFLVFSVRAVATDCIVFLLSLYARQQELL